jgi:hypothetical protein
VTLHPLDEVVGPVGVVAAGGRVAASLEVGVVVYELERF